MCMSFPASVGCALIGLILSGTGWPLHAAPGQNRASPSRPIGVTTKHALGNAITDVDQSLLSAVRTAAHSPPVASRDIGMVGIAMYDAVNAAAGIVYQPYSYSGGAVPLASADAAAYYAGYSMLKSLFPAQKSTLQFDQDAAINNLRLSGVTLSISRKLGISIATNFFNARANDGSASAQTPYTPGNQPGNYQFTNPTQTTVVQPNWGEVTPFAITSVISLAPLPLWGPGTSYPTEAAYLTSHEYLRDLDFVRRHGCSNCGQSQDELNLTAFWADTNGNANFGSTATPPGHWVEITDTVATNSGLNLLQTARLRAMVGAALADAAIVAWWVKNDSDFWRPDTAIHATGWGRGRDPTWEPLWPDPPFQSYISGHSTFSMAAASVLTNFFATDNVSFCAKADPNAHDADNNPFAETRCFTNFMDAALEAGDSRVLGGIHFPADNVQGLETGEKIAHQVALNLFGSMLNPVSRR
jgi:PAP2 superfamily